MSKRERIRQTLLDCLETDSGEKFDHLEDSQDLRTELGLDSVDFVSMISQLERRFKIRLSHQELQTLGTVGDVLDLLETKITVAAESSAA